MQPCNEWKDDSRLVDSVHFDVGFMIWRGKYVPGLPFLTDSQTEPFNQPFTQPRLPTINDVGAWSLALSKDSLGSEQELVAYYRDVERTIPQAEGWLKGLRRGGQLPAKQLMPYFGLLPVIHGVGE